jgi:iron complex outermembrane receptor protein/outer membrane receptor for ferrienterochelin and colicins
MKHRGNERMFVALLRHGLVMAWMCMLMVSMPPGSFAQEDNGGPEVFELGEVIVTERQEAVTLATTVTEVTEEDITARSAQTVGEALELIPGVDIQRGGKGQSFVRIRGFDQSDVKVLIDGVPAHEAYFRTLDLSLIPVDAIAKITVTKGASSVLYGANTLGGVVNIITKKGGKKPYTSLTTSFGDYDTRNYIFNHGGMVGNFNYWFTYGYRESDGFRLSDDFDEDSRRVGIGSEFNEDGGKRDLSDYIKRTVHAKIGYEPNADTKVYLSFDYHNNERGIPTEFFRYWRFSKWDQWHLNLVGQQRFSDLLTVKARGFYVDHEDTVTDVSWDADHQTSRKWFEKSSYDDYSVGGELQTFLDFGKYSYLKLGFDYIKDNHEQQDFFDDDTFSVIRGWDSAGLQPEEEYEADTYTFAVEDEIRPTDRLSFVFGLSYDYYDPREAADQPVPDSTDAVNPQGGVVFNLTDATSLHASIGKKTRFPHLKELYSELAGGNPDLDPQETIAYEIGAEHYFTDSIKGSIAYFYNDIDDLIYRDTSGPDPVYVNIGEATIQGVETDLEMKLTDDLRLGANYTYLSTNDEDNDDRELEGRPRHRVNVDIRSRFDFGLAANVQASYTHRQFEYLSDSATGTEIARKTPDFFLLNARISQSLPKAWGIGSEFFAEVTNITDRDYDEGSGPEPGRNFLIGLTLRH